MTGRVTLAFRPPGCHNVRQLTEAAAPGRSRTRGMTPEADPGDELRLARPLVHGKAGEPLTAGSNHADQTDADR
jgi:hypothetical protein